MLLPLALLLMGNTELVLPEPIEVPEGMDTPLISKAILTAMAQRHWLPQSDTGSSIVAELHVRRHMVKLRIDYTRKEIRFWYLDSSGMDYEVDDGQQYIHSRFNSWSLNLARDIRTQVHRFRFEREPVDVVPPARPVPQ
jgi:hypothetical protein